jgi:CBS domain-containing protein
MTIAAVLSRKGHDVISVPPEALAVEVARLITRHRIGAVVVRDAKGRLAGIVSERDIVRAVAERPNATHGVLVREIMTREVVTATPETPVREALAMMDRGYFRHLPVLDAEGRLAGIVSVRDLVTHLMAAP